MSTTTRYGNGKLKVPPGFATLLERFAREVLRNQPLDISAFGAEYFQKLVEKRDATGVDPLIHDIDVETRISKDTHFGTSTKDPLKPGNKDASAAVKIQAGYRGYQARKEVRAKRHEIEQEKAAVKIQASYKGYKTRKAIKQQTDNTENVDNTINIGTDKDAEERAATKIQSTYRGHKVRSDIKQERAATKIQAQFRGHKVRKGMNRSKTTENEDQEEIGDETTQEDDVPVGDSTTFHPDDKEEKEEGEVVNEEEVAMDDMNEVDKTEEAVAMEREAVVDDPVKEDQMQKDTQLDVDAQVSDHEERKVDDDGQLDSSRSAEESVETHVKSSDYNEVEESTQEVLNTEEEGEKEDTQISREDSATLGDSTVEKFDENDLGDSTLAAGDNAANDTSEPKYGSDHDAAALKIQSRYRGYKARKNINEAKPEKGDGDA